MADDEAAGRRRSRGPLATARAEALERLKALRRGGRRSESGGGYDIKVEDPIYDTVEEDEYAKLVARRREEAQGFIVDDDGLGYGDEGQEEDWTQTGLAFSSDEEFEDGEGNNRSKRKKAEKKEKETQQQQRKVNPALSAAAAMMGKQRISKMFTAPVFKNRDSKKVKSLDCENIVDEVIAEFAPDEADREKRRRSVQSSVSLKRFVDVKSEVPVVSSINLMPKAELKSDPMVNVSRDVVSNDAFVDNVNEKNGPVDEVKVEKEEGENMVKDELDIAVEVREESVVKMEEKEYKLNAKITTEERDPALSATAEWQAVRSCGNMSDGVGLESEEQSNFELEADGSLPFYIIDAHEEIFGANTGTIYLFGKVIRDCQSMIMEL